MPAFAGSKFIALWIFDLGYWGTFDYYQDAIPRVIAAKAVLDEFAGCFADVKF
jgi:hypothetical protein